MTPNRSQERSTTRSSNRVLIITSVNLILFIGLILYVTLRKEKIVYVDSVKLLSRYEGMAVAKKAYDAKVSLWNANLDTLKMEMEAKLKEYEIKLSTLSVKEKNLMEELLETKRQQYINYQQMVAEKMKKEDQELTQKIYDKVDAYLKKYGEDNGYAFILGANQYGSIVYAKDAVDITADVLEGLNSEFKN